MPQVDHRLEALAYHEAGHAVVGIEFGRQVREVWIDPSTGRGKTVWRGYEGRSDDTAQICISMAGLVAEEKFYGSGGSFPEKMCSNIFKHCAEKALLQRRRLGPRALKRLLGARGL